VTTTLIVLAIIAAVVLVALLVLLPRMRAKQRERQMEREIATRRSQAADRHRGVAQRRETEAERLEREARAARLEADAHAERAQVHERGLADDQLVDDQEEHLVDHVRSRDREFDDGRAVSETRTVSEERVSNGRFSRDRDGDGVDDRRETGAVRGSDADRR
jgi:FtsZ-interacting cell division protein ZipA